MKLFIKKSDCTFDESVNGEVMIVETFGPIYIEEYSAKQLLHSSADTEFGLEDKPYLCDAPKDYEI